MRRTITIAAALVMGLVVKAEPCYQLEPIGYCAPDDIMPLPGGPPEGNHCQALMFHPHGVAVQCLDVSTIPGYSGYKICIPNTVIVYVDYTWLHEVNGRCLDDDQKWELPNVIVGSCQQDYIPMMAAPCPDAG